MKLRLRIPPVANKYYRMVLPVMGTLIFLGSIWSFFNTPEMPDSSQEYRKPMMALEFATTQKQVDDLAEKFKKETLIDQLELDTRVIVPVYCGYLMILTGVLFFRRTDEEALWLLVVPLVVAFTGFADVLENSAAYGALSGQLTMVSIHPAAVAKWAGFAMACILIGSGFVSRMRRWTIAAGVSYVLCGVVIGWALVRTNPPLIDTAFPLLGLAVMLTGEAIHSLREPA